MFAIYEQCVISADLKLLGVNVHFEQGVTEDMSKTTRVEVAIRSSVVVLVVDLRELEAAVFQQFVIVKFLVGHVNLDEVKSSLTLMQLYLFIFYSQLFKRM